MVALWLYQYFFRVYEGDIAAVSPQAKFTVVVQVDRVQARFFVFIVFVGNRKFKINRWVLPNPDLPHHCVV